MPYLQELLDRFDGRPIPHCPGRYVLRGAGALDPPHTLCPRGRVTRHDVTTARDTVEVTWLDGWGLISYARPDGTWLHTANTPGGFRRKLVDLGILSADKSIGGDRRGDDDRDKPMLSSVTSLHTESRRGTQ